LFGVIEGEKPLKGKKPTAVQRRVLSRNGIPPDELDSWFIQKIKIIEEGSKRLTKDGDKYEQYTLVHRKTGEVKVVDIHVSG
jgi:hypothetical protein